MDPPPFAEKSPNCRFLLGTITCCFIAEISSFFMKCLFHISYGHLQGRLCFGKFWRKVKMAPWLVLPTLSTDRVKSLNLRRSPESISASFFCWFENFAKHTFPVKVYGLQNCFPVDFFFDKSHVCQRFPKTEEDKKRRRFCGTWLPDFSHTKSTVLRSLSLMQEWD